MNQKLSQYYLRKLGNSNFSFVVENMHEIITSDIEIKTEDYNNFLELQSQGKQFKSKEVATGESLFDYIEEYVPEIADTPRVPSVEERMAAMEELMLSLL